MNENFINLIKENKFGFDVYLCKHCNLKCRSCIRYSSISKPEFYDFVQLKKDFKHLKKVYPDITFLTLSGGEPLLHPKITEIIILLRNLFPNTHINILSNLKIFHKFNYKFYKTLHSCKINISYTRYPTNEVDFELCEEICKKYKIGFYNIFDADITIKDKKDYIRRTFRTNKLSHNIIKSNLIKKTCFCQNDCPCIWNGKLFQCGIRAFIDTLNEFYNENFEVSENDYIKIADITSKEDIYKFWLNPISFCKYCFNKENKEIEWSKKIVKEDWIES